MGIIIYNININKLQEFSRSKTPKHLIFNRFVQLFPLNFCFLAIHLAQKFFLYCFKTKISVSYGLMMRIPGGYFEEPDGNV